MNILYSCIRCHFLSCYCECHNHLALSSDLKGLLLTHACEPAKLSNTGRLVMDRLEGLDYEIWQRKKTIKSLLKACEKGFKPILLHPEPSPDDELDIRVLLQDSEAVKCVYWVVLDSTWQQSRKMLRLSPQLQSLPRMSLAVDTLSEYDLRRNQQAGNISTAECFIHLLSKLGDNASASQLTADFYAFITRYKAQRNGHYLND